MSEANLVAYAAQVAIVVLLCAGLPRVLKLRSPGVQYAFWRALLLVCLMLPIVQPRQAGEMVFVTASVQPPSASALPRSAGAAARVPPPPGFNWIAAAQIVIPVGMVARFAWIGFGLVRLRRMRRRAVEAAAGFEDLQDAIRAKPPIFWSSEARHPVTFGVLRPVVLLPMALKTADPAAQRAVVAHELHHVKRRDWGWVVAEELVRSVFWFHPAMWWLVSRVQLARETVVDELSILATNARRTYLDTLMAFADDTGLVSPPAFSARRHLFHRIMLLSKEGEMSSIRVAVGSCVLVLALGGGTWGAVTAFPLHGEAREEQSARDPQQPPRDPISADAYHRTAVEFFERAQRDTMLRADEKRELILSGIAAEDRALALRPDFISALTYKNIFLRMLANLTDDVQERNNLLKQADALRSRVIELHAAGQDVMVFSPAPGSFQVRPDGVPPPPPPPPPARSSTLMEVRPDGVRLPVPPPSEMVFVAAPDQSPVRSEEWAEFQALVDQYKPTRVGGSIKMPTKIRDVKPVYPPIAQVSNVQGVVILEAILDESGSVVAARVLRSIPLLDQAALGAVKQWQFTPPLVNGVPQPVMMTVTVNFTLPQ